MYNEKTAQNYHCTKLLPEVNRRLSIKYTKDERLDIGRRIYEVKMTRYQAAEVHGVNDQTV